MDFYMAVDELKKTKQIRMMFIRPGGNFIDTIFPDGPMIAPCTSLLYLAGVFKHDQDVEIKILDAYAYPDFAKIKSLKKEKLFYFGMEIEKVLEEIRGFKPDVIALTSTANYFFKNVTNFINQIKENFPEILVILGGPDPTNDYKIYFSAAPKLDLIVMGEGEITIKNIIESLKENEDWRNTKGISYINNEEIVVNTPQRKIEELDKFESAYELVDFKHYFKLNELGFQSRLTYKHKNSHKAISIVTSRGCPELCTFCSIYLHMGRPFRAHSAEYVLNDLKTLIEQYDVRHFHFEDDNLTYDKKRFKDVLRGIIENKWNITWDTPNGIRADLVDREFLELCKKTGCVYLIFGVESGSQKMLDNVIRKNLELSVVVEASRLCYEYEIDTLAFYILGFPDETKEETMKTYNFALEMFEKYSSTPIFQIWRPYTNTELEKKVDDKLADINMLEYNQKYDIPYTLFHSKFYHNDEVDIEFISNVAKNYLKESKKFMFKNWFKIAGRRPVAFIKIPWIILFTLFRLITNPRQRRLILQQEIGNLALFPFYYSR